MKKLMIIIIILFFFIILLLPIYYFDKIITPNILAVSDSELRVKCIQIINEEINRECSKELSDTELIHIDKDKEDNIVLVRADVMKMNRMAINISLQSQKRLLDLGNYGISIPLGYVLENNLLAHLGPSITVRMEPLGSVEVKYYSEFESAGINQTREKIYLKFSSTIRIILPRKSNTILIENQVPIAETIILGKIPSTNLQLDLKNAGYK